MTQDKGQVPEAHNGTAIPGAAYAALPDEGEPWRGHKFKEVQRGCWRCDCGKTIKEVTSDQSTPASGGNYPVMPKRYTVDDDGEELFTAEKMRAFADATCAMRASHGEAPAQPDQPIACSYGDNGYACCEGGPCQADVHNDKLAEQQAPAPPPECETEAEKRAFAFGWFKALESERMKAESVPKAQFDDPKVQAVYAILCNGAGKQGGQHGTE